MTQSGVPVSRRRGPGAALRGGWCGSGRGGGGSGGGGLGGKASDIVLLLLKSHPATLTLTSHSQIFLLPGLPPPTTCHPPSAAHQSPLPLVQFPSAVTYSIPPPGERLEAPRAAGRSKRKGKGRCSLPPDCVLSGSSPRFAFVFFFILTSYILCHFLPRFSLAPSPRSLPPCPWHLLPGHISSTPARACVPRLQHLFSQRPRYGSRRLNIAVAIFVLLLLATNSAPIRLCLLIQSLVSLPACLTCTFECYAIQYIIYSWTQCVVLQRGLSGKYIVLNFVSKISLYLRPLNYLAWTARYQVVQDVYRWTNCADL
ncbi:hypothetical protein E2C01_034013 [Portunus trituberculatus]|uniref:Uncharacterized protein n=1 Tax=Portunus trituberculatus TaxID=210409 RepID=A0A5B7F4Z7_PORTR|nr:hypothetical protein [Portunus trituberculatus]